ncbi:MAG: hypothetical protein WD336_11445 [Trueperaceae bacterium]
MTLGWPDLSTLATVAVVLLLLAGALAPFEALGWWAGWYGDEADEAAAPTPDVPPTRAHGHLVFLSGIHSVAGRSFAPRERAFLERLGERLPEWEVLEVFPYSVTNRALTGQRVFRRLWRLALRLKTSQRRLAGMAGMMINLRNAWQVAVSADRRYGPMYDEGSAELIAAAVRAAGFRPDRSRPLVLIGYSGGGQIALGASEPLSRRLGRPVWVVSLGGVMASPRTLTGLRRLVHLHGSRDLVTRIGAWFFPGRWPFVPWSAWNRARARGWIRSVDLGPVAHTGEGGYLDDAHQRDDGRSHLAVSVDAVANVAEEAAEEERGRPEAGHPA